MLKFLAIISVYLVLREFHDIEAASAKCEKTATTMSGIKKSGKDGICSGDLIFEETFDSFDLENVWSHEISLAGRDGNWEFQQYTNNRSNSFVEDGILNIRPTLTADDHGEVFLYKGTIDLNSGAPSEQCTNAANNGCFRTGTHEKILNPIKSARIRTLNSFSFKYGKVEVNAKLPAGDWMRPAISFLPKNSVYGKFPASGEIDLVETRGNRELIKDTINIGVDQMTSSLHYAPYAFNSTPTTSFKRSSKEKGSGFSESFHRFQMEWNADRITFSLDDVETGTIKVGKGFWAKGNFNNTIPNTFNPWQFGSKMAPFDQEFYLVIDLAIGGITTFPEDAKNVNGEKPWKNDDPLRAANDFWHAKNSWLSTWKLGENKSKDATLQVDYIRVWAL